MAQTQICRKHIFPSKFEVLSTFVAVLCVSTEEISFSNSCWPIMARSRNMQQQITLDKPRNIFMIGCLLIFRRLVTRYFIPPLWCYWTLRYSAPFHVVGGYFVIDISGPIHRPRNVVSYQPTSCNVAEERTPEHCVTSIQSLFLKGYNELYLKSSMILYCVIVKDLLRHVDRCVH